MMKRRFSLAGSTCILPKAVTALMLLLLSGTVIAQSDYCPLLQVGKAWHLNYPNMSWPDGSHDGKWMLTVEKDTVVGGEQCFKVLSWLSFRPEEEGYVILQEKDHKVWELSDKYSTGRKLLFDFTLGEGDPVTVDEGSDMTVESIDSVKVLGHVYRRVTMYRPKTVYNDEERQVWIEGVGGESALLLPLKARGAIGLDILLDSCTLGDRCLFRREDFNASSYHVSTDKIQGTEYQKRNMPAFDLQGRRLSRQPRGGLHIRNGRKVLVR